MSRWGLIIWTIRITLRQRFRRGASILKDRSFFGVLDLRVLEVLSTTRFLLTTSRTLTPALSRSTGRGGKSGACGRGGLRFDIWVGELDILLSQEDFMDKALRICAIVIAIGAATTAAAGNHVNQLAYKLPSAKALRAPSTPKTTPSAAAGPQQRPVSSMHEQPSRIQRGG